MAYNSTMSGTQVQTELDRCANRNTTVGDPGSDAELVTEQAIREALDLKIDIEASYFPTNTRIVRPEWWGALADGNETDGRPLINGNAIIAAQIYLDSYGGGTILFSPGTYKIGGDRIHPAYTTFLGAGANQTFIELVDDGNLSSIPTTGWITPDVGGNVILDGICFNHEVYTRADDVRIIWSMDKDNIITQNCKFICRNHATTITGGSGHRVLNCQFVNSSLHHGNPAVSIGQGARDVKIIGNTFDAGTLLQSEGSAMASVNLNGSSDVIISKNIIGGSYQAGILIENNTCDKVLITANIIDISNNTETGVMHGIYIQHANKVQARHNTIIGNKTNANNAGIKVQTHINADFQQKTINNNDIIGWSHGLYIADMVSYAILDDLSIKNNVFTDINTYGIHILANNLSGYKDYLINIDGNEFHNSPSIRINTTADAGNIVIKNNTIGVGSSSIDIRNGCPKMSLGGNSNSGDISTKQIYNTFRLWELPTADFEDIQFLDKKVYVSEPIDLSGGAVTIPIYDSSVRRMITKIDFVFVEASSGDTGIDIVIRDRGASGTAHVALTYTTEISQSLYYEKTYYSPDMNQNCERMYSGYEYTEIYCAGGKTGIGEVVVKIEYVETFGFYST